MKIEFSTDNDVFCNDDGLFDHGMAFFEIATILNDIKVKVWNKERSGVILDSNGNKIGEWSL